MELGAASDMVTDYLSAFGMEADQAAYFVRHGAGEVLAQLHDVAHQILDPVDCRPDCVCCEVRKRSLKDCFSASEAAEALKYMALAGWDVEQSTSALGGVLNLAAARLL